MECTEDGSSYNSNQNRNSASGISDGYSTSDVNDNGFDESIESNLTDEVLNEFRQDWVIKEIIEYVCINKSSVDILDIGPDSEHLPFRDI